MTTKRCRGTLLSSVVFTGLLCCPAPSASAQAQRTPAERLDDITAATSLSAVTRPWRLKLSVTLLDPQGAASEGTVESWRAGDESRTVASLGGGTTTDFDHAGQHFHAQQGPAVPQLLYDVLDAVLHPGPEPSQLTGAKLELRMQSFGKQPFECIMVSRPIAPRPGSLPPAPPLGLFPTYCMQAQSDHLEVIYSFGNPTVQRSGLGKFADHEITTAVLIANGATVLARGKVVALSTYVPTPDEFTPPAGMLPVGPHIPGVASGVIAGFKTGGAVPAYPASARMAHISGSVVLRAIIGSDGHIQRLTVMSAGDPDLAISALTAVRTWTYKPYLLNGEPTSIDTTITVNFNLSPG